METKIRRVITRSGRGVRGYFPSRKNQRSIPWESPLERDACLLFEFSPGVTHYREYQQREVYYIDSTPHDCYPDYCLTLHNDQTVLVEIKPESKLRKPSVSARLSAIAQHFQNKKRLYRILTDRSIRRQPLLENLTRLAYHNRDISNSRPTWEWRDEIGVLETRPFSCFSERLGGDGVVLQLMANAVLRWDPNASLNNDSPLHFADPEAPNDAILF